MRTRRRRLFCRMKSAAVSPDSSAGMMSSAFCSRPSCSSSASTVVVNGECYRRGTGFPFRHRPEASLPDACLPTVPVGILRELSGPLVPTQNFLVKIFRPPFAAHTVSSSLERGAAVVRIELRKLKSLRPKIVFVLWLEHLSGGGSRGRTQQGCAAVMAGQRSMREKK